MSRIGNLPIEIPNGVKAEVAGGVLKVEGPKGKLDRELRKEITAKVSEGKLTFKRNEETKQAKAFHGMERALANNMVKGVSEGYIAQLEFIGVGYKADVKGNMLKLGLGYSHDIDFPLPEGIKGKVVKEGRDFYLELEAIDNQLLGQTCAQIRSLRPPEPYKGKGVKFRGEQIRRKAGKAGKK